MPKTTDFQQTVLVSRPSVSLRKSLAIPYTWGGWHLIMAFVPVLVLYLLAH